MASTFKFSPDFKTGGVTTQQLAGQGSGMGPISFPNSTPVPDSITAPQAQPYQRSLTAISTPQLDMNALSTMDLLMGALSAPSKIAGGIASGTFKGTDESLSSYYGRLPYFEDVASKELAKNPAIKASKVPPTALGIVAGLAIPPFGGEGKAVKGLEEGNALIKGYLAEKVSTEVAPKVSKGGFFSDLYTRLVDRFNPINKTVKETEKIIGGKLPVAENPYETARRYLGIKSTTEQKLFWKTSKMTPDGDLIVTGEGLSGILKPIADDSKRVEDLRALLVAEREVELAKRGITTGIDATKADQVITALKSKYGGDFTLLSAVAKGTRDYARRAILDPLLEIGRIDQATYDAITKSNDFYTPFQRVMDDVASGTVPTSKSIFQPKGSPLKPILGSERKIIDPLESIVRKTYEVTDYVERQRVANLVGQLSKYEGMGEVIKRVPAKTVPVATVEGQKVFRPSHFAPEKNTIRTWENGKEVWYQVPPDLFKAMETMSGGDAGVIAKVVSFPAKMLRVGATLTLEFIGRNPVRDQFIATIVSKFGYKPGIDLISGIWSLFRKDELYQKWLASGGAQSMFVSLDRLSNMKTLANVLGKRTMKDRLAYLNPIEALRALSEFGEKGTRIGEFKNVLSKGKSEATAALASREITIDFARLGADTKVVNQIIAFWGANVQGVDVVVRAFKERPIQTSLKVVAGITAPSITLFMLNKDNSRYQEMPQWERDLNWIIHIDDYPDNFSSMTPQEQTAWTDSHKIIKLGKPFELGIVFGTVPEHILDWIYKNDPNALTSVVSAIQSGSTPGFIPTALVPILENQMNYSYFRDRPIVSQTLQNLPSEMQFSSYTTETAKQIGGLLKVSPLKVENMVRGYFAGLGSYALSISDKMLSMLGIVNPPPSPEPTGADIPGVRAFVSREPIGSNSESVNKFYEYLDKANKAKQGTMELIKRGNKDESLNFLASHKEAAFATGLGQVSDAMSKIRKQQKIIMDSITLSSKDKKVAIQAFDRLITELAFNAVTLIENAK